MAQALIHLGGTTKGTGGFSASGMLPIEQTKEITVTSGPTMY